MIAASPRDSTATSLETIDLRRPFSPSIYISQQFGPGINLPLLAIFENVRRLGGRTLVIEDIEPAECILIENRAIRTRIPSYNMHVLRRLTFWSFRHPEEPKTFNFNPRSLLNFRSRVFNLNQLKC